MSDFDQWAQENGVTVPVSVTRWLREHPAVWRELWDAKEKGYDGFKLARYLEERHGLSVVPSDLRKKLRELGEPS